MSANVVVPEVGESIVDARVAKWLKKEGDAVSAGEPLVELETDKIDLEVAAPRAGVLSRIAHADGSDVKVGEGLAVIEDAGSGSRDAGSGKPQAGSRQPEAESRQPNAGADRKRATPAAKNAAHQNQVDLKNVQGT